MSFLCFNYNNMSGGFNKMRPRIQIYLDKSASAEEGMIRGIAEVVEQGAGQWNRNKNPDGSSPPPQMAGPKIKGSPRLIKPMRVN
jgi:hypothetical protein